MQHRVEQMWFGASSSIGTSLRWCYFVILEALLGSLCRGIDGIEERILVAMWSE
jgi:hypothetical protein